VERGGGVRQGKARQKEKGRFDMNMQIDYECSSRKARERRLIKTTNEDEEY
jgi:hypothetical protein